MKVDLLASKQALAILAENYDKLAKAGVKINISLESDDFLSIKEEKDEIRVKLNPKNKELVNALDELAPLAITLLAVENDEYTEAEVEFLRDLQVVKVKCPFCGYEDEYVPIFEPTAYPYTCRHCGAMVSVVLGDKGDVVEAALMLFRAYVLLRDLEVKTEGGQVIIRESKHEEEARAIMVDGPDENGIAAWLLFFQRPIRRTNKELIQLIKDKSLYIGKKFIYEGKERQNYVIKKVRRAGGSSKAGLIGVPQKWVGREAIVLVKEGKEEE